MDTPAQLDDLMETQRRSIRWYCCYGALLFLAGVGSIATVSFLGAQIGSESIKSVLSIAGVLVSSVCVFPLKEINGCRGRLIVYHRLRLELISATDLEKEKINALVWEILGKLAGG
jgi:hypothetical protein